LRLQVKTSKQHFPEELGNLESVQAEIRLKVKKILRKYGYPPDKQEKATQTVLAQAELIAKDWTGNGQSR